MGFYEQPDHVTPVERGKLAEMFADTVLTQYGSIERIQVLRDCLEETELALQMHPHDFTNEMKAIQNARIALIETYAYEEADE